MPLFTESRHPSSINHWGLQRALSKPQGLTLKKIEPRGGNKVNDSQTMDPSSHLGWCHH